MRMIPILLIVVSVSGGLQLLAAGNKKKTRESSTVSPIDQYIEESARHATESNQGSAGSIWTPEARFLDLSIDLRARRIDDIVTVQVVESASAVTTGSTKTKRTSSAEASIPAIAGIPRAAGPLPNLLKGSSDVQLDGAGATSRSTLVRTTLSARVTHVLPNGNLIVEGSRTITVNSEAQIVTVRGIVRPIDLDTGNNVLSSKLAQMEVKINGRGVVGDAIRRPNILYRILLGILPF
jgi:flagellar L-ring protein FlgH